MLAIALLVIAAGAAAALLVTAARAVSPLLVMGAGAATILLMEAKLAAPAATGTAPPLTATGAATALLTGLESAVPAVTVTVTVFCIVTVTVACGPHAAGAALPAAGDPETAFSLPVWPLPAATDAAAGWKLTLPPIGANATSSLVAGAPVPTDGAAGVLAAIMLGA